MLCGCIDIGTNTTRVLVAEAHDGTPHRGPAAARVHAAGPRAVAPAATIPAARIAETASVVAEQVALARQAGAAAIRTVATAVIRSAANRDEFCAAMRRHGGVEVSVLDGEEEARLAFLGATRTLGRPLDGRIAVVDVGGGSSEIADRHGRRRRRVVALVQRRLRLPGRRALRAATRRRRPSSTRSATASRGMLARIAPPPVDTAVAVGGSAASLRRLVGEELDRRQPRTRARPAHQRSGRGRRLPLRSRRRSACG